MMHLRLRVLTNISQAFLFLTELASWKKKSVFRVSQHIAFWDFNLKSQIAVYITVT